MRLTCRRRDAAAVFVVCATLGVCIGGAGAARASRVSAANLCSVSKSVATNIVDSTKTSNITGSPAFLKAYWNKVKSAEPVILGAASGGQKTDFQEVFSFINAAVADLSKANWNYTGLLPYEQTLSSDAAKIKAPLAALKTYYTTTCKFKV